MLENGMVLPHGMSDKEEGEVVGQCACGEDILDYEEQFETADGTLLHDDDTCLAAHLREHGERL